MTDFHDRTEDLHAGVAVVTGAGRGLGRALSLELARRGMRVAAIGRSLTTLSEVAAQGEGRIFPFEADVADADTLRTTFACIAEDVGPMTILINNAAVYPHRDILDESPESFMETMDINLGGPINTCLLALPLMVEQGFGRIINVGSFAGIDPAPVSAAYSISKGGALILMDGILADTRIRFPGIIINNWMPGVLKTTMGVADGLEPNEAAAWGARLALLYDRELNGLTFDRDTEVPPLLSFKRRLFNKVMNRTTPLRRL